MKFTDALGTRVARRVVALFVLCALLPTAAAILISYGSVRDALDAQRSESLRREAANFATSLVERLGVAEAIAHSVTAKPLAPRPGPQLAGLGAYFAAAVAYEPGGLRVLLGSPSGIPAPRFAPAEEARLAAGESAVVTASSGDGPDAVWLVRGTEARRVAFEISPAFLWAAADALPPLTEVCVFSSDWSALHCTQPLPAPTAEAFRTQRAGSDEQATSWGESGARMLSVRRELFLRGRFVASPWTILVSQPESLALAAAERVARAVLPVALLGLLVAALLGLVQVRRIMRPLRDLTDAAARVGARDFTVKVSERGNDEFGALARDFNAMATRLERQFGALTAHAEIDAVILTAVDMDRIAAIVLGRMAELAPADRHLLLLAEGIRGSEFRVHSAQPADVLDGRSVCIAPSDARRLLAAPEGQRLREDAQSGLTALVGLRTRHAYALPIAVGDALAGVLILAYLEERQPDAETVSILRDLGDRVAVALGTAQRDQELSRRAYYDALTQLPNRLLGLEELERAVAAAQRQQRTLAVLFVDLDGFSQVNDSLGHPVGDQLLVQCAERLRASVRKSDVVARLGGDEFAVVLPEVRDGTDAARAARNTIDALTGRFTAGGGTAFVSASVGIALYPADGASAEELLRHADLAMFRAKQQGRGQFAFFEASMNAEVRRRVELEGELRLAIERREFELHYQPQLDLRSGRLVGGEALIRWRHPLKGLVPPLQFIGLAEANGLIEPIGRWALDTACAQFVAWRRQGIDIEHVSVNMSPRQLRSPDLVRSVREALQASGMPAGALRLEITESAVIEDHGVAQANLAGLVELGTPLELDDFGTGYSSLAHLQRLPVAAVKLDRGFTHEVETKESARAVVKSAIDMSHAVGKTVVAEGVETAGQLALLQRLGCDMMQGYHIGRPVPAEEFAQLLHSRARAAPAHQGSAVRNAEESAAATKG